MKDFNTHKLKFSPYLEKLYQSDKPLIIYKVKDGYNLYTDFSKKIILTNYNIDKFFNIFSNINIKKETDLSIGFFGHEILCNLLKVKIKNQKKLNKCIDCYFFFLSNLNLITSVLYLIKKIINE